VFFYSLGQRFYIYVIGLLWRQSILCPIHWQLQWPSY